MPEPGNEGDWKSNMVPIAWFVAIAIVLLAAFALFSGRGFSLGVGGDSGPQLSVNERSIGQPVDQGELADAQAELETQSAAAQDNLVDSPLATQAVGVDMSGLWFGAGGLTYQIFQLGAAASITESDQFGNITAYGEGTVTGSTFTFEFTTAAFTTGTGSLTLDQSQTQLQGTFSDGFGTRATILGR